MVQLRLPPLHAFRDLVLNQIPDMFPKLRFGFIEAAASWVPYLLHKLRRDNTKRWKPSWRSGADLLRGREDLPADLVEKIMCENPRKFYGL